MFVVGTGLWECFMLICGRLKGISSRYYLFSSDPGLTTTKREQFRRWLQHATEMLLSSGGMDWAALLTEVPLAGPWTNLLGSQTTELSPQPWYTGSIVTFVSSGSQPHLRVKNNGNTTYSIMLFVLSCCA